MIHYKTFQSLFPQLHNTFYLVAPLTTLILPTLVATIASATLVATQWLTVRIMGCEVIVRNKGLPLFSLLAKKAKADTEIVTFMSDVNLFH